MRNIKNYCVKNNLNCKYCSEIFYNIVNRIEKDKEFKKRQNFVGLCANILKNLGLIKIFNNKIFYLLHPYMKLEITRRNLYEKN